jgi:hypothetical protein
VPRNRKVKHPTQAKPLIIAQYLRSRRCKLLRPLLYLKIAIPRAKAGGTHSAMGGSAATPNQVQSGKPALGKLVFWPPTATLPGGLRDLNGGLSLPSRRFAEAECRREFADSIHHMRA